jgi:hypothetical protein
MSCVKPGEYSIVTEGWVLDPLPPVADPGVLALPHAATTAISSKAAGIAAH